MLKETRVSFLFTAFFFSLFQNSLYFSRPDSALGSERGATQLAEGSGEEGINVKHCEGEGEKRKKKKGNLRQPPWEGGWDDYDRVV